MKNISDIFFKIKKIKTIVFHSHISLTCDCTVYINRWLYSKSESDSKRTSNSFNNSNDCQKSLSRFNRKISGEEKWFLPCCASADYTRKTWCDVKLNQLKISMILRAEVSMEQIGVAGFQSRFIFIKCSS